MATPKTVKCKRWTASEEQELMDMPTTNKKVIKSHITSFSHKWGLSYNKVYQKWYKLHNGFYKRNGAEEPMEWEKSHPKRKSGLKGLKRAKKTIRATPRTTPISKSLRKAEKSVSLNPRVRMTPTTVVIAGFKKISIKNKNIKITY